MSNIIEVKNLVKNYKDVHAVMIYHSRLKKVRFSHFSELTVQANQPQSTFFVRCLKKHQAMLKSADMTLTKKRTKSRSLSELFSGFCT